MDLAEIRKKARIHKKQINAPVVLDELLPDALTVAQELPEEMEETGDNHQLQNTLSSGFATEEEYTQGLIATDEKEEAEHFQWVGFFLGAEEFALDIDVVSELIKPRALTELPQVPDYVCGIITLRGEVIPVIDLSVRLGLKRAQESDPDLRRVVVCEGHEQRVGVLVDRISQVVRMPVARIEKPHLVGDNPAMAFVASVGRKDGHMLIKLMPEKVLTIEDGAEV